MDLNYKHWVPTTGSTAPHTTGIIPVVVSKDGPLSVFSPLWGPPTLNLDLSMTHFNQENVGKLVSSGLSFWENYWLSCLSSENSLLETSGCYVRSLTIWYGKEPPETYTEKERDATVPTEAPDDFKQNTSKTSSRIPQLSTDYLKDHRRQWKCCFKSLSIGVWFVTHQYTNLMVAHTCSPSHLGNWSRRNTCSSPA